MLRKTVVVFSIVLLALAPAIGAAAAPQAQKPEQPRAIIAVFPISGVLQELPAEDPLGLFAPPGTSLKDLVTRLRKAAQDPAVKAVVLLPGQTAIGQAQAEEIRQAMGVVRQAGKEIYVHADSLDMNDLVLYSGASRLSVVPTGIISIAGMYAEVVHVRGLLDMIGVKPDFMTCGEYKSAAEMFMRDRPSPEADRMYNWLFDSLFEGQVRLIASGRGVAPDKARGWIDGGLYTAERAKSLGIIDAVEQREQFQEMLRGKHGQQAVFDRRYGQPKQPQFDLSSPFALIKIWADLLSGAQKPKPTKDAVAIVYVTGPIMVGSASDLPFFSDQAALSTEIRKALDRAVADDKVKAVVLRVNSPGGSAVASEIILNATRRVKAKKPFVVSMGEVAGSGGYYVACASDVIFADESTITASIGVVSGKLATSDMWKKVGITFQGYARGHNAGLFSSADVFSADERAQMRQLMDDIYGTFKGHVVAARGPRLRKPIDELAGGRVFSGRQALELGLVDRIGTLHDAVEHVAAQAKLTDYDLRVLPEPKSFIERILESATGGKDDGSLLDAHTSLAVMARLPLAALPSLPAMDPHRVAAVRRSLRQLQIIQAEGAALAMPEVLITN